MLKKIKIIILLMKQVKIMKIIISIMEIFSHAMSWRLKYLAIKLIRKNWVNTREFIA